MAGDLFVTKRVHSRNMAARSGRDWMSTWQKSQRRMPSTRTAPVNDATFHEPHTDRQALKERIVQLEDELRARDDFLAIAAH